MHKNLTALHRLPDVTGKIKKFKLAISRYAKRREPGILVFGHVSAIKALNNLKLTNLSW